MNTGAKTDISKGDVVRLEVGRHIKTRETCFKPVFLTNDLHSSYSSMRIFVVDDKSVFNRMKAGESGRSMCPA